MQHLLTKWHPEDDPVSREQYDLLESLLGDRLTETAVEGFLIVSPRYVDEFGNHRTAELARVFDTDRAEGKQALLKSLEHLCRWVGGMEAYEREYPVEIVPARPAFPQFRILGIEALSPVLYRVLDSTRTVNRQDQEPLADFIIRTGRLPAVPKQLAPVRRDKADFHWCSYGAWATPLATQEALQILPKWSDCKLRATLKTAAIAQSAYVAFNGDRHRPPNGERELQFYNYFYEPIAQDHPGLPGGAVQIAVDGAPPVHTLELFDDRSMSWRVVYEQDRLNRQTGMA